MNEIEDVKNNVSGVLHKIDSILKYLDLQEKKVMIIDGKGFVIPHCAVCNRDVEKMEWKQDFCTLEIHAKAYCHGETEIATLPHHMIDEAQISKGVAFMNKRIEEKPKAFDKQVEPQIGLTVKKHAETKDKIFNREQELFYRATDYRGS